MTNAPVTLRSARGSEPARRWPWIVALLLLSIIPVGAGLSRLIQLATLETPPPADMRFFEAPWPVAVHIVTASIFMVVGGLQLDPRTRRRRPGLHRRVGWVLVVAGALSVVSALWMVVTYAQPPHESVLLSVFRWLVGGAILGALALGTRAALEGDYPRHGAWMLRAYALSAAAGTQSLLLAPVYVFHGPIAPVPSALVMGACWALNLVLAELWLRRAARQQAGGGARHPRATPTAAQAPSGSPAATQRL